MNECDSPTRPGLCKRSRGKPITSTEQIIIKNVCKYFEKERENGNQPLFKANAVSKKVASATGFSIKSIHRIQKQSEPYNTRTSHSLQTKIHALILSYNPRI